MQDVLKAVMGVDNQPFGILRITSLSGHLSGRLAIARGSYIVGAVAADDLHPEGVASGYDAVRKLLLSSDGNFAFLDSAGKHPSDMDDSLYISIDRIVGLMPDLPEDASRLFDEKSLLDKVFGPDGSQIQSFQIEPDYASSTVRVDQDELADADSYNYQFKSSDRILRSTETSAAGWARAIAESSNTYTSLPAAGSPGNGKLPRESAASIRARNEPAGTGRSESASESAHNTSWQVFQPLIGNAAKTQPESSRKGRNTDGFAYEPEDSLDRQAISRLREAEPDSLEAEPWFTELFRESFLSKTSLIWISAILILVLVATLFAASAVKRQTSLTIQKNGIRAQP